MKGLFPFVFATILSAGCATTAAAREPLAVTDALDEDDALPPPPVPVLDDAPLLDGDPAELQPALAVARKLVGGHDVVVDGVRYRSDCSNFVRAAFLAAGHDVFTGSADNPGLNGVRLIREYVERNGRLFTDLVPRAGDIVFFDDTYDRDRDGQVDDALTHVGIVDLVEPDGTIWFIHRSHRGVVRDPMHLGRPSERAAADGRVLNAWVRPLRKADPPGTKRLAGELFAGFGRLRTPGEQPLVRASLEALLASAAPRHDR